MNETPFMKLELRSPLVYVPAEGLPLFTPAAGEAETLFCFSVNPEQGQNIEPLAEGFLREPVFSAIAPSDGNVPADAGRLELPVGIYLFSQKREVLGREACIAMAVEQQKDGLWERLHPENRLYVRYLFEDGKPVTQIFRPLTEQF